MNGLNEFLAVTSVIFFTILGLMALLTYLEQTLSQPPKPTATSRAEHGIAATIRGWTQAGRSR